MLLGVLDQSPIAEGSPGPGAAQLLDLAELTDRLGYHRYWSPSTTPRRLACAAPEILIGAIAPRTRRIRWAAAA